MESKYTADARLSRFAKICCNISLVLGIVLFLLGLMPVFQVVYYVFALLFAAVVITVWLLSLILFHPFNVSFLNSLFKEQTLLTQIQQFSLKFAPYLCVAAIVLAVVAVVLVRMDKSVKIKGRIVATSLAMAFSVVGTVALYLGVLL